MSNTNYIIEKFILLLYSNILSAESIIKLDDLGLNSKVKFNFNLTSYPRDISVFVPRSYKRKKDYFSVGIPLPHRPYIHRIFTQAYIREEKNEYSRIFKKKFTQQDYTPYIFESLEKWLIFRFFHFLFKHTGTMRNNDNQIGSFVSISSTRFWDILKIFLFPFWFIKFFSKSFPKIVQFLENVKELKNYTLKLQELTEKMDISDNLFKKFPGLYPVWFDDDNFYLCKFLDVTEINYIFFGEKKFPKWFINLQNNFERKGFKFNKKDTKWLNDIEIHKISVGKYICFYFDKKKDFKI